MQTFIAVCLGLITLELGIAITAFALAMCKVGKAAQAVEVLAYRVDQQVEGFSATVRSGWFQGAQTVLGLVGRFWKRED